MSGPLGDGATMVGVNSERSRMVIRLRTTSLLRLLLIASIVGPALVLGLTAWLSYRQAFADAEHELSYTSEVALEHASKVFDSYMLIADRVQDGLEGLDEPEIGRMEESLHHRFQGMIRSLPQIQSLIVLDRDSRLQVATEAYPVDRNTDFSKRDYVQALKQPGVDTFVSKVQTSLVSGKTFFGWGRTRRSGAGDYDGVIDLAVAPDFFTRFYATLVGKIGEAPDGRVVTMLRSDGQILVRYPPFPGPPPMVPASNPFFEAVRARPDGGDYVNASLIDKAAPRRLFAFRKVPGHSIYIVAGRSLEAITGEWRRSMLRYVALGVSGGVVLFALALATLRGTQREKQALRRVQDEMDRREVVEAQLRQAQKLEAIGQLTGGVAHDFNNILTVIRSSVDLLQRPNLSDERRRRYIAAISDTTTRATKLTGQLLAFARRQALKPEVLDIGRSVAGVGDMIATLTGSRIRIDVVLPEDPCYVFADPNQFDTSVVNMVVNARDAMDGTGRLTITVATTSCIPGLRLHPSVSGAFVALSIADTGSGIAPDMIEEIFEPFFTTKGVGHGTGLGLSQVFGFARQSGGEIRVESEVGTGTTFTLYLPRAEGGMSPHPQDSALETFIDGRGTCVLVVEDNADVGTFATHTLAELGYATVWAPDAEKALQELAHDSRRFDVVFSDVVMPGMSGIELAHEVRRLHPDLPVVLTSGYSHVLAQQGTDGFELLHKPYSVEDLSRVLQTMARGRGRKRGAGA